MFAIIFSGLSCPVCYTTVLGYRTPVPCLQLRLIRVKKGRIVTPLAVKRLDCTNDAILATKQFACCPH